MATLNIGGLGGYNKGFCGNHDDLYCRANSTKGAPAWHISIPFLMCNLGQVSCQAKDPKVFVMQPAALQRLSRDGDLYPATWRAFQGLLSKQSALIAGL